MQGVKGTNFENWVLQGLWVIWCRRVDDIQQAHSATCPMSTKGGWKFAKMVVVTVVTVITMVLVTSIGVLRCWCSSSQLWPAMSHIGKSEKDQFLSLLLLRYRPSYTCDADFRSHQIKPTSTFQRFWGRGALFQRDKKGTERDLLLKFLIWWKVTPALWLCAREDKHKIGILHFARFSQQRWEGWNLEKNYDLIISTKPRGTHIYLGFSSVSKPAQTGLQFHLALAPALQWSK